MGWSAQETLAAWNIGPIGDSFFTFGWANPLVSDVSALFRDFRESDSCCFSPRSVSLNLV